MNLNSSHSLATLTFTGCFLEFHLASEQALGEGGKKIRRARASWWPKKTEFGERSELSGTLPFLTRPLPGRSPRLRPRSASSSLNPAGSLFARKVGNGQLRLVKIATMVNQQYSTDRLILIIVYLGRLCRITKVNIYPQCDLSSILNVS